MRAADLIARADRGLAALIILQTLCWTLAPALSHSAPPLDVVEMYAWGREGVVATFKHPNLPGLVLEPIRLAAGQAGWAAYLVSQLFIGVTLWAVFALGRELMGAPRALAGTLLLAGVYFFSWPTPEFNHNVAQMPLWALVMLLLWRATTHDKLVDWLLLGGVAGLSLWAKYSSGVLLVVAAGWMLWDAEARRRILTPGPWLALAAFVLAAAPQALWLMAHDFSPFAYAARRASGGAWWAPLEFLLTLALDHLPMLLLLAAAGWFGARSADAPPRPEPRALRYLLLLGLGPALLTATVALLTGAGLRASWGAPMVVLSGLIVVTLTSDRFNMARLRRLGVGAGVLIVLLSALYFAHMRFGALITERPLRGNWPQAEVSRQLEGAWLNATDAPLRIVAGDIWTAGLVGLNGRNPPSVLINGDFEISPWVTREEANAQGVLLVWRADERAPAPLQDLAAGLEIGRLEIAYPQFPDAAPIALNYAIIPPQRSP